MRIKIYLGLMTIGFNVVAQQTPTGSAPPANTLPYIFAVQNMVEKAWYRGGNLPGGSAGNNNIFGTMWNSPIFMQTNGANRITVTHLPFGANLQPYSSSLTNPLWNTNLTRIGISRDGSNPIQKPFCLLHLGYDSPSMASGVSPLGYRSWQDIGTMYMAWTDNFYVGLRQKNPNDQTGRTSVVTNLPTDYQDAVITWGDNSVSQNGISPITTGLSFIFHSPLNSIINDGFSNTDYGREVMRMDGDGHVGIGPVFYDNAPAQNMLHINNNATNEAYIQISNTNGTGQSQNDGLHLGITSIGNAELVQKENRNLKLFTNNRERVIITQIGAPGISNPGNVPNNITRVAISHNPATPVTRPLALLHLGYNTGSVLNPTTTDGWRSWMDVGTFISQGTDNMYIGLKNENGVLGDRQDAVISFGDNYTNVLPGFNIAPDKLRIIFTSPAAGQPFPGPGAMSTQNGLEFVRYVPFHNTSLGVNDPRTGFGDFESLTPVGTINPGNTIEINSIMNGYNAAANTNVTGSYLGSTGASGLRFRDLTSNSKIVSDSVAKLVGIDVDKVLTVDSLGNVVLIRNGAGGGADVGNYCSDSIKKPLTDDYEILTNNFNYRFKGPSATNPWGTNYVGIGTTCSPTANLDVISPLTSNNPNAVTAVKITQTNLANNSNYSGLSIGMSSDVNALNKNNIGVATNASNATNNYGVYSTANAISSSNSNQRNVGVYAEASRAPQNFAMRGRAVSNTGNSSGLTIGGWFSAENSQTRIGVMGDINGAQFTLPTLFPYNYAIGVYGWNPSPSTTDYAGYFEGKVNVNGALTVYGAPVITSDANLKTNIDSITNASEILQQIEAKTFYYDTTNVNGMKFPSQKQYGVIAQQVEGVLPELVSNNYKPAMVDSSGTVIYPAKSFKTVNYNAFIALLIKAIQEQQHKIDSLTNQLSNKDSIQDARLTALENAIATCCTNNSAKTANNASTSVLNQMDVELSDKDAIVLNQNVPNPFAEQTTITYNVPSSVGKAQLLFYNSAGQIIQTVDIKTRGKGKVNVFAADLSSGMYHYTLVADGQVVDSKKMVRE